MGITFEVGGPRGDRKLVGLATLIAKRDIAQNWRASQAPPIKKWRAGMDWVSKIEEQVYIARGCPGKHAKIWGKWWAYYGLAV